MIVISKKDQYLVLLLLISLFFLDPVPNKFNIGLMFFY